MAKASVELLAYWDNFIVEHCKMECARIQFDNKPLRILEQAFVSKLWEVSDKDLAREAPKLQGRERKGSVLRVAAYLAHHAVLAGKPRTFEWAVSTRNMFWLVDLLCLAVKHRAAWAVETLLNLDGYTWTRADIDKALEVKNSMVKITQMLETARANCYVRQYTDLPSRIQWNVSELEFQMARDDNI